MTPTNDDITQINGNSERLEGKIQARHGHAKNQVQNELETWLSRMWTAQHMTKIRLADLNERRLEIERMSSEAK